MAAKLSHKNEEGIASIESVMMMVVFTLLMTYGIGVFGIVHTANLNNIAARTYAWETFNHRTNVQIFRDNRPEASDVRPMAATYINYQFRLHSIASEDAKDEVWEATERTLSMGRDLADVTSTRNGGIHRSLKQSMKRERVGVNPVWIKTLYGICLESRCGGISL